MRMMALRIAGYALVVLSAVGFVVAADISSSWGMALAEFLMFSAWLAERVRV